MSYNKVVVSVLAGVVILLSVISHQFHNIFLADSSNNSEIAQPSGAVKNDFVTLLSKEDIIGTLPSIYPGELDAVTTGSCGIQLPWEVPQQLAQ